MIVANRLALLGAVVIWGGAHLVVGGGGGEQTVLGVGVGVGGGGGGSGGRNPLGEEFGELVRETLETWRVPGLSVAVVDGEDVWAEGYGFAQLPATPETLYWTGSTTKAFTAAALSLLIDATPGLDWTTPVSALIRDEFVLADPWATAHTTLEDLLSHRSGLPRHDLAYGGGAQTSLEDVVRALRHLPLTAEPRVKYQYSNLGYVTASYVIEKLTGAGLGRFLKNRIWAPLGMNSTYFGNDDAAAAPETLAQGYVYSEGKMLPVPLMDFSIISGAGSIVSNVLDYAKWVKANLDRAPPISPAGHRALRTSRVLAGADEDGAFMGDSTYALGWGKSVYRGHEVVSHNGGTEAFGATVLLFPGLRYGVVGLGNTGGTSNAAENILLWKLVDDKLNIPTNERFNWTKQEEDTYRAEDAAYASALTTYYPHLPSPRLPLPFPLANYTGTYYDPGYQSMQVALVDDELRIDRRNSTWSVVLQLEHVSGNFFLARGTSVRAPGWRRLAFAAEFEIGSDGKVGRLGMALEGTMGVGGRVWFERVE